MSKVDCVIVGAGVVGLAIGRAFSKRGLECLLIEKNVGFGMETSSRHSEVIHRGMYYPKSTLKSQLCLRGRELLLRYIREKNIPHSMCGKVIISSTSSEHAKLQRLHRNAELVGIDDLLLLSGQDVRKLEPQVQCFSGLLSPGTGIFDSHTYMTHLVGDIEESGSWIVYNCDFIAARKDNSGFVTSTSQGEILSTMLVNAAGLSAPQLMGKIQQYPHTLVPKAYFAKGSYFKLSGSSAPFSRLVYPLPSDGGLGVHCTLDLHGGARFGPDVEWLPINSGNNGFECAASVDPSVYAVDASRRRSFVEAISKYWPGVKDAKLTPDYAGVRPKLQPPVASVGANAPREAIVRDTADFAIEGVAVHGVEGLVTLLGIESPGLTSSLAIAEYVETLLLDAAQ